VLGPATFKEENALPRSGLHSSVRKREIAEIGRRDLRVAAIDLNRLRSGSVNRPDSLQIVVTRILRQSDARPSRKSLAI
jgi:hypothetical protein